VAVRTTSFAGVLVALALAAPAGAAIVNVNCATQNLQARMDAAPAGSTLRIKGTCVGNFTLNKNLTLDGNPRATLDGGDLGRTLFIAGTPTVRLFDLTITGGHVSSGSIAGGGISHTAGALTIRRVTVTGNVVAATGTSSSAAAGGGIASFGGSLALFASKVSGNSVVTSAPSGNVNSSGGGIYRVGDLRLENTIVAGNSASGHSGGTAQTAGGGIHLQNGALTLLSSSVTGNRGVAQAPTGVAVAVGGGIEHANGETLTIRNSSVSGNRVAATGGGATVNVLGGGVFSTSESVTIVDSRLERNAARARQTAAGAAVAFGGTGYVDTASLTMTRSRIVGSVLRGESIASTNMAGGALYLSDAPAVLRRTRIASSRVEAIASGGSASAGASGGGVYTQGTSLTLEETTLDDNRVSASSPGSSQVLGAGIRAASSDLVLRGSTVSRNVVSAGTGAQGGGIVLQGPGIGSIVNSTIAANRVSAPSSFGGGINASGATLTLTNATVARNVAKLGGGLMIVGGSTTPRGTIIAQNTADSGRDCWGPIGSAGYNLIGSTSGCAYTSVPTDKLNRAARLAQLGSNGGPTQTVALLRRSPALNAIPKAQCPTSRDQRGVRRPQGTRCEIGAYERKT
jgi:hypothetical protein